MQNAQKSHPTQVVGLLLFDGFSNLCLANAVEPMRAANTLSGRALYDWRFLSLDGAPLLSSSALPVTPMPLAEMPGGDHLFVMPSYGYRDLGTPTCLRALRAAATRWQNLAGLDSGSWLLAAAGLLDGHRVTGHWDVLTELAESFPDLDVVESRFVIDGNRLSSGGATTTLELMLDLIARDHGAGLALEVAALFMFGERDPRQEPYLRLPPDRLVRATVALMRRHVEMPLSISDIAARLGVSRRRLEGAFRARLSKAPAQVYRDIRLAEARRWVEQTGASISEIAARCGYENPSAMTRAFRTAYGTPPSALRRGE